MPDMTITLKNGINAEVVLVPTPRKNAQGAYPQYMGHAAPRQPSIFLTFRRDGRVIAPKVPWGLVIAGKRSFILAPGVTLDADDLHEIDSKGWNIMMTFGMFPTEFAG
jgi:hypothetical protein